MLIGAGAELFDIVLRMDGLGPFASELTHCVDIPPGRHRLKVSLGETENTGRGFPPPGLRCVFALCDPSGGKLLRLLSVNHDTAAGEG
jgi:hypothetical protein